MAADLPASERLDHQRRPKVIVICGPTAAGKTAAGIALARTVGVINAGPPYKMVRIEGNRVKAEQLFAVKAKGATVMITPCHNCHSGLEDINHHYHIGFEIKFLGDLLYEAIEKPVG